MKLLIGLVGEIRAGKETFASWIEQVVKDASVARISTRGFLQETLERWGIEPRRENLQKLAIAMNQNFGLGTLTGALRRQIELSTAEILIYDAIRWRSDMDLIRSFTDRNLVVYITADQEIRWGRTRGCDDKVGENTVTFAEFQAAEQRGTETDIPILGREADCTIINNSDLRAFRFDTIAFLMDHVRPKLLPLAAKEASQ